MIALYMAIGDTVTLEPFFVIPVAIASWYGSDKSGISLSFFSAAVLILINTLFFHSELNVQIVLFYGLPYVIAYSGIALLITNFRNVHRVEVTAAETDYLTGICNSRCFHIELAKELIRSHRYNHFFSLAYLDIDNFKLINDTKGHEAGDQLLVEVANCLKSCLRKSDTVGRLGGDEYAFLLPETKQDSARKVFLKVSSLLRKRMRENEWPVSFSIGLVTFEEIPEDIKEAIKVADELMYSVKSKEKNNVAYKVWHGKVE